MLDAQTNYPCLMQDFRDTFLAYTPLMISKLKQIKGSPELTAVLQNIEFGIKKLN